MKALSVMQPWAFLIAAGDKTIELRSRSTTHRGPLLICASKTERDCWVQYGGKDYLLPVGVMMCVVDLVDCRPATDADADAAFTGDGIEKGSYAWVLQNPRDVMLREINGRLGLFDVDDELIEYMPEDDLWFDHSEIIKDPSRKIERATCILQTQ